MSTYLITGANRGIGLELCRQLVAKGDQVLATCRTTSPELNALGVTVFEDVNVGDDESVKSFAQQLEGQQLDVIINNAGILLADGLDAVDMDQIRQQLEVNTLGPLRMAIGLRGNLDRGGKFVIITSLMGSISDNGSGGYYGYRMSKAAVNAVGMSLSKDLHDSGIAVGLLHPGMVATEMTGGRGIAVETSVSGLLARVDELTLESTGSFRHQDGQDLPW
ncbi:MAG: NAD(P)-dependent dehydrogenase (short-subunit alcohol dehydrogenase family) [Bacteroidia bacterium]|jgi:NAD(P)-dependent dehydrogenase (short-subunit alcohol dehydrogenase family)